MMKRHFALRAPVDPKMRRNVLDFTRARHEVQLIKSMNVFISELVRLFPFRLMGNSFLARNAQLNRIFGT